VDAAVEGGVDAQIAADLDAGIGAGDVLEAGSVERADPHILDGLCLDRKIGRLRPAHGEQARGGPKDEGSNRTHILISKVKFALVSQA